jgi:hypothetical protein
MKRPFVMMLLVVQGLLSTMCFARGKFLSSWEDRVRNTSACQPSWVVPVVTASSGIVQLARVDLLHQYTSTHFVTWNYGNSKGFDFIPFYKTELDINSPPYLQHNNPKVRDGTGDFSMALKYRLFAGNETHHNYSVSAQVQGVGNTASYSNGLLRNQINPSVIAGKGFGRFDVQSTLGGVLPVGSVNKLGRTVVWNTVAQYKVGKIFWPELEVNANYYFLGPNNGKDQVFMTPGLMVRKLKFYKEDPKNRLVLVFGGGMQIATSHFHSYNHGLVLTTRLVF